MIEKIIKDLYYTPRYLLGKGFDDALSYINNIIPLDIKEIPSGTEIGNWIVPDEWDIKDAWVKFNGEKILDWKENPLCVTVGSLPVNKTCTLEEFKKHLHWNDEYPDKTAYDYRFYDKEWGFVMPKNKVMQHVIQKCEGGICTDELQDIDPSVHQIMYDGLITEPKFQDILPEGEYEVFIDSSYTPGKLKYGVHTIKGKSDKEILLFAHLDHPWMANDNLSGVACLVDLVPKLKERLGVPDYTIKLIFCAETVGSIAYATNEDISKVEFVIAVDAVGNDNSLLMQKAYDKYARINYVMHLATAGHAVDYRKGEFRGVVGSDEYYFNDPLVGIPGIMLSRIPYPEYHTDGDTPEICKIEKIEQTQEVILNIIDVYQRDYIPTRDYKGPLMRSRYGIQTPHRLLNLGLDNLLYEIDGKKYLSEIVVPTGLGFDFAEEALKNISVIKHENMRTPARKKKQSSASR